MNELSLGDVLTGVAAALSLDGCRAIHRRSLHSALATCQEAIVSLAAEHGFSLALVVRLHPEDGESTTLQHAVVSAIGRGVFRPEGPALHISIGAEEAAFWLERVPGGLDLHGPIARMLAHAMHSG